MTSLRFISSSTFCMIFILTIYGILRFIDFLKFVNHKKYILIDVGPLLPFIKGG